jgi:hypothetical protein
MSEAVDKGADAADKNQDQEMESDGSDCDYIGSGGRPNRAGGRGGRAPTYSAEEKELLMELIDKYQDIVNDTNIDFEAAEKKRKTWEKIETEFRKARANRSPIRTSFQLRPWWKNTKRTMKEQELRKQGIWTPRRLKAKRSTPTHRRQRPSSLIKQESFSVDVDFQEESEDDAEGQFETIHLPQRASVDNGSEENGDLEMEEESNHNYGTRSGGSPGKRYSNMRSVLLDFEYEEHKMRMKTLEIEQETAEMRRKLAARSLQFKEKEHELQMKILKSQLSTSNSPIVLPPS